MANVFIEESTLSAIGDAIRAKTGKTDLILPSDMATEITGITTGGESGGSSELVKYVTFMSYDGTTELYKKPTIIGDDCVNVVSKGLLDTPTKESTNTTNYTYNGWSLTLGGSADSSALKNITEDRIVYASFAESVRYYTVDFYDEDGITLLNTLQTTYGSDVSNYIPEKEGYIFNGWSIDVSYITTDISTVASWSVDDGIIHDTWTTIKSNCDSGNADKYKIGDKKNVVVTNYSGTVETIWFTLVAKGTIGEGSLTFVADNLLNESHYHGHNAYVGTTWEASKINTTYLPAIYEKLEEDLKASIGGLTIPSQEDISNKLYDGLFLNSLARQKLSGTYNYGYHTRTVDTSGSNKYYYVDVNGVVKSGSHTTQRGLLLQFNI